MKDPIVWIVVLALALVGAGVYYFQSVQETPLPASTPAPAAAPDAGGVEAPAVRYPIPEAPRAPPAGQPESGPDETGQPVAEQPPALPQVDDSDALLLGELARLFPGQRLGDQLRLDDIARRFVVTIDNLTASKLPRKRLSTQAPGGRFAVSGEDDALYLSPGNFSRYTPFVQLVDSVDSDKLVAVYIQVYPLFQQVYEELGYPSAYFNDRLIDVIDHLLEAPDLNEPLRLVRSRGLYQFADPQLEALSAGQKLLIRAGPDNAARVKDKLRELRAALSGASRSRRQAQPSAN